MQRATDAETGLNDTQAEGVRSQQTGLINGRIAWIRRGARRPRVRIASPVDA